MMRWLWVLLLGMFLCQCAGNGGQKRGVVAPDARIRASRLGLVDVKQLIPDAVVDLRYGTPLNVTYQPVYPLHMPCLLHYTTAEKLAKAADWLRPYGFRLKIWDAWRPPEVQMILFDHAGWSGMFADPSIVWSRHCSGTAVDVTLVDANGRQAKMPTGFDEGGPQSYYLYRGNDEEVRRNLHLLQSAMVEAGFSMLDIEWWHFDDAQYDGGQPPPIVYAGQIGVQLPKVNPPRNRKRR